jgi:hypothetical protein
MYYKKGTYLIDRWIRFRVRLLRFQIHCELETFQFLLRNDSQSNQNHLVKSFGPLLKRFRFNENDNEVNQNHLKHLFCRFMVAVQKHDTFQTHSHMKHFNFPRLELLQVI